MHNSCYEGWVRMNRYIHQSIYKICELFEGRRILARTKQLTNNDNMTVVQISDLQFSLLKKILIYAQMYVPYYQKVFSKLDLNCQQIMSIKDFEKIPFLTKNTVHEHKSEMISSKYDKRELILRKTGGSTGSKLEVYYDRDGLDVTSAVHSRCMHWCGKKNGEREVHFSSNIHSNISWRDRTREYMKCLSFNRKNILLDIFQKDKLIRVLEELKTIKPVLVQGFPSIGYQLALCAEENKIDVANVFCYYESTGETLYEFQKEKIERIFQCQVYNRYGNAEFGIMAHECSLHQGLHIQSDVIYMEAIEFVDTPAGMKEIVVTGITNNGMPLIRYRTGDLGEIDYSPCQCGLPYPRLINIRGRIHDFLELEQGVFISTFVLLDIMDKISGINNFQVCVIDEKLILYVVPRTDCTLEKLQQVRDLIRAKHDYKIQKIDIILLNELQLTISGKFRYTATQPLTTLENSIVIESQPFGSIIDSTSKGAFPILSSLLCISGFYEQEKSSEQIFVWSQCKGRLILSKDFSSIEILNPMPELRTITFQSELDNQQIVLRIVPGWKNYELALEREKIYSYFIECEVSAEYKNHDPRQIGFGFREKKVEG